MERLKYKAGARHSVSVSRSLASLLYCFFHFERPPYLRLAFDAIGERKPVRERMLSNRRAEYSKILKDKVGYLDTNKD